MYDIIQLFITFFIIGLVSFGGGYSMIPLMQTEIVNRHEWITLNQFTDIVAISGMSPGPIAVNMAVSIGYTHMKMPGAIIATLGMVLPSLIVVLFLAICYKMMKNNKYWNNSLYGIKAVVTGFIVFSAIIFIKNNEMISADIWYTVSQLFIFLGSLAAIMYFKKHPVYIIFISGLIGVALYS